MFGIFRRNPGPPAPPPEPPAPSIPPLHPLNPAEASVLLLRANDGSGAEQRFDMVDLLLQALQETEVPARRHGDALLLDDNLIVQPRFVEMEGADGRVRSATTIQADHPRLYPDGLFEYQHGFGTSPEDALMNGFRGWATMDRVTLAGALEDKPDSCLIMQIPLADGRQRRVVMGPFSHYMSESPEAGTPAAEEAEKFCPCCLFSSVHKALDSLIEPPGTIGLRLFASVNDGVASVDCRANGFDHAEGAEALKAYTADWLPKGRFEFRKQYVILHDLPLP